MEGASLEDSESPLLRSRPAFVVGCPRSGTTLVKMMLDAHPNISCGPETLFMRHMADLERQHLRLTQFLITEDEWHAHLRDLFLWLHVRRATQLGKTRWVDKSPSYALIPDYLDTLFPDCQIVHVIRDPRDVVDSWRRRWGTRSSIRATRLWPLHVRRARAFGAAHPDRYFEVRYEDLVRSPEPVMRDLIEFLEEQWDDRVLRFTPGPLGGRRPGERGRRGPASSLADASAAQPAEAGAEVGKAAAGARPAGGSNVFTSSVGAGRRLPNLPSALLLRISCRPLMRELGYS